MSAHAWNDEGDGYHCGTCGASYHCPQCSDGCGMMGHLVRDAQGDFYTCTADAERLAAWRRDLRSRMAGGKP